MCRSLRSPIRASIQIDAGRSGIFGKTNQGDSVHPCTVWIPSGSYPIAKRGMASESQKNISPLLQRGLANANESSKEDCQNQDKKGAHHSPTKERVLEHGFCLR